MVSEQPTQPASKARTRKGKQSRPPPEEMASTPSQFVEEQEAATSPQRAEVPQMNGFTFTCDASGNITQKTIINGQLSEVEGEYKSEGAVAGSAHPRPG